MCVNLNPRERIWIGEDDIPARYAAGVSAGIGAAYASFEEARRTGSPDGRGGHSTETSPAWHRGFKAGYHSVRSVIGWWPTGRTCSDHREE